MASTTPGPKPTVRTALVTGASSGIGLELATLLARNGYDLHLVARGRDALESTATELRALGRQVNVLPLDLAAPGSSATLHAELGRQGAVLDVLVNSAGIGTYGAFHEIAAEDDAELMQLNMVALAMTTKLVLRDMVARGSGRILNVASLAAFQPGPFMAAYCASKAFVLSLTEAIASEVAGTGVTVSALCPGVVPTGFQQRARNEAAPLNRGRGMDARRVAEIGYRGMMKGRTLIVPGLKTKLMAMSGRFAPRSVVTRVARGMLAPKER